MYWAICVLGYMCIDQCVYWAMCRPTGLCVLGYVYWAIYSGYSEYIFCLTCRDGVVIGVGGGVVLGLVIHLFEL